MRWLRLFFLGLASVYPLYWTAQFVLFFLPASLRAIVWRLPLSVVDISYLQATAISGKVEAVPAGVESLVAAVLFALAIWCLRGDKFLTGGLAIVILGQSALLPFLHELFQANRGVSMLTLFGIVAAMALICVGLYRILAR